MTLISWPSRKRWHMHLRFQSLPFVGNIASDLPARAAIQRYLAMASGYTPKLAHGSPAPTGSADRQQPTACAPGSHRFQPPFSASEARRPTSLPTQLSRPPGLDPTATRPHCASPAHRQAMPCRVPRYSPEILEEKKPYLGMQQCLRGAWRVCPNVHTTHGTSFVPQLRNVFRTVFKSAFTDVSRSVFGSTTNRATAGACRV